MIAWVDLETTGLSSECSIIEFALVVTDNNYNELFSYEAVVKPVIGSAGEQVALNMHNESGLLELVRQTDNDIAEIDYDVADRLCNYKPVILGGQSVHFDRGFIERWMPQTNRCLSHRQIDVSSLKLLWSNALGVATESLPPDKSKTTHRAMEDIVASIEAAKWYRDQVLSIPKEVVNENS